MTSACCMTRQVLQVRVCAALALGWTASALMRLASRR